MANQLEDVELNGKVKIIIRNVLIQPNFELSATVPYIQGQNLLYYLERSAEAMDIRFQSEYFPRLSGYMIISINGRTSSTEDQTWWKIEKLSEGAAIETGVSSHVPENGEIIIFDFVQGYSGC